VSDFIVENLGPMKQSNCRLVTANKAKLIENCPIVRYIQIVVVTLYKECVVIDEKQNILNHIHILPCALCPVKMEPIVFRA